MFRLIAIGIMGSLLYVGIASFDSLINLKVDTDNESIFQESLVHAETPKISAEEVYQQVPAQNSNSSLNENVTDVVTEVKAETTSELAPTEKELKQVAEAFYKELIQPANEESQVLAYSNKLDLKRHLTEFASLHVVSYYVDGLYEEKDGSLFIIPMDSPPWIVQKNPAEVIKVSRNEYVLSQTNKSELHGAYKISISFKKTNNSWMITNVLIGNAI